MVDVLTHTLLTNVTPIHEIYWLNHSEKICRNDELYQRGTVIYVSFKCLKQAKNSQAKVESSRRPSA